MRNPYKAQIPVAVASATLMGGVVVLGGPKLAFAGCVVLLTVGVLAYVESVPAWNHLFRIELPFSFLLLAAVQWRTRSLTETVGEPIDAAVMIHVALMAVAIVLATRTALLRRTRWSRIRDAPLLWMLAYAAVACVSVPIAASPVLAGYAAGQVGISVVIVLVLIRSTEDAGERMARCTFWCIAFLVVAVWIGLLVDSSSAMRPLMTYEGGVSSPLPWRIQGVFPGTNSDFAGIYGALLALWCFGATLAGDSTRKWTGLCLGVLGVATVIVAQYRTGYLMLIVGALVLLAYSSSRRPRLMIIGGVIAGAIGIVVLFAAGNRTEQVAQGVALRGQNQRIASTATGRTQLWQGAVDVWKESPIVGRGIQSAIRYEVIEPIGGKVNQAHSTWFEALCSAGFLGAACIACSVLVTGYFVLRRRLSTAMALWAALLVLSIFDGTMSFFRFDMLVYLLLAALAGTKSVMRSPRGGLAL
jgi:O-antigen ligase